jgi:hypothetical protein
MPHAINGPQNSHPPPLADRKLPVVRSQIDLAGLEHNAVAGELNR